MTNYSLLELYLVSKENKLNYDEQLSLFYSNYEKVDMSLETNIKCAVLLIVAREIIKIILK